MTITTEAFLAVGVGASANDGTGDSLRAAFVKVNQNFSNISDIGFDTGNIAVTGSIEATGNITSAYFIGDGSQLTGVVSIATTNVAVTAQYVTANAQANITSLGNLTSLSSSGNIQTTQNVIANIVYARDYLNSDGSDLLYPYAGNALIQGNIVAQGNIQATQQIIASGIVANQWRFSDGSDPFWPYLGNIIVQGNLIIANSYVPTSNTSSGIAGQIVWDNNNVYICVATNTWKRAALTSTF